MTDYTYIYGDRVWIDPIAFNESWEVNNPHGGAMELTDADMPMTATYSPKYQGVVRLENSRHIFFCPTAAVVRFERANPQEKVSVVKMTSNSLGQSLIARDYRDLLENLETFYPHDEPLSSYRVGETLTIEFVEMTQAELDELPEFIGF